MPLRSLAFAAMLILTASASAFAADAATETPRRPGEIARDAAEDLLRRLDELVAALPRYGLPEINEKGDIVIPRKPSEKPAHQRQDQDALIDL